MYPNRQKINDVDAGRARRHPSGPTGLWRVPGAHVDAVGGSRGALEWGAVSVLSLCPTQGVHHTYDAVRQGDEPCGAAGQFCDACELNWARICAQPQQAAADPDGASSDPGYAAEFDQDG
eukprot:scaffold12992_cov58-Phaeocystis_antarctica.AAC.10